MDEKEEVQLYLKVKKYMKISDYIHVFSIIIIVVLLAISRYMGEVSISPIIAGYWIGWSSCQFTAISQKELLDFLGTRINKSKKSLDYLLKKTKSHHV